MIFFNKKDEKIAEAELKRYLTIVLKEFKNEPRIVFWDLVNEPAINYFFKGEKMEKKKRLFNWNGAKKPS